MHDGATPQVFRNAASLRKNMTEPEIKLWEYLIPNLLFDVAIKLIKV